MIYNLASILCWSVSPIMIRFVKDYFSVSFQNFFRFSFSIVILWIFTLATIGWKRTVLYVKGLSYAVPKFLLISICIFAHQLFLTEGVYLLLPGIVTIVEESAIIFAAAFAFIFLPQEREFIMQPKFIMGITIAIAGVVVTTLPELSKGGTSASTELGLIFIFLSSLSWALFSLVIRLWMSDVPSVVTTSIGFSISIPFFLLSMILEPGAFLFQQDIPLSIWGILAVSGIIGIGLGYSFYYQALKGLGVTLTTSAGLLIPVFVAIISFFVFGERLSPVQLFGSIILLAGCAVVVRTKFSL